MQLAAVVASKVAANALQSLASTAPARYVCYMLKSNTDETNTTCASNDQKTSTGLNKTRALSLPLNEAKTKRLGSVSVLRQAVAWLLPPAVVYTGQARSPDAATTTTATTATTTATTTANNVAPDGPAPNSSKPARLSGPALCVGPTLSVGSACNALYAGNRYDLVINCCPREVRVPSTEPLTSSDAVATDSDITTTSPEVIEVNLEDTNDAQLDIDEMVRVIGRAQQVWNRNGHILVNCWMGASRSVAVTCVLMCCLDRCIIQGARTPITAAKQETEASTQQSLFDRMAAAEEAFNCAYGLCARARPTVNMSNQLCAEVKRVLVALF